MVYGHFITDTVGNERFFVEGCNYCQMSSGGQHEPKCPCKDVKIVDRISQTLNINKVKILKYDDEGNFIKEIL